MSCTLLYNFFIYQNTADTQADEEDIDEIEEDDRDKFADQLCSVGALGRLTVENSLIVITRLVSRAVREG